MDVVVSAPDGRDSASCSDFSLDLSFGESGNNFELSCPALDGLIKEGSLVSIDGTEYGGVVDSVETVVEGGFSSRVWKGRTWHGVLLGKVLVPDAGKDYLHAEGEANAAIAALVERTGLSGLFRASVEDSGIAVDYDFERFADAYTGLRSMLSASGARLAIRRVDGATEIWAEPARLHGSAVDSDLVDFEAERMWRPVNHLVCAGAGELSKRVVVHLYANRAGKVSKAQSMFGADEVAEFYDDSNSDAAELEENGRKKLAEYQQQGGVSVTVRDGGPEMFVGDSVMARDNTGGMPTVTATVAKKIAKAAGGALSVSYEMGDANTSATGNTGGGSEGGASASALTAQEIDGIWGAA